MDPDTISVDSSDFGDGNYEERSYGKGSSVTIPSLGPVMYLTMDCRHFMFSTHQSNITPIRTLTLGIDGAYYQHEPDITLTLEFQDKFAIMPYYKDPLHTPDVGTTISVGLQEGPAALLQYKFETSIGVLDYELYDINDVSEMPIIQVNRRNQLWTGEAVPPYFNGTFARGIFEPNGGEYDQDQESLWTIDGIRRTTSYTRFPSLNDGFNWMMLRSVPDDIHGIFTTVKVPWNFDYLVYKVPFASVNGNVKPLVKGVNPGGAPNDKYTSVNEGLFVSDVNQFEICDQSPDLSYFLPNYPHQFGFCGDGQAQVRTITDGNVSGSHNYNHNSLHIELTSARWSGPDAKWLKLINNNGQRKVIVTHFYGVGLRSNPPPYAEIVGTYTTS